MSIQSQIPSAKLSFWRSLPGLFLALIGALILSLPFQSCFSSDPEDEYVLAFKLDSTKVGKFDSVRVEIYNGKVPGPGDTTKPIQVKTFLTPPGVTEVKLQLSKKVNKDFSVVIIGLDSTGTAYRKQHTYEDFLADDKLPAVLLLSKIIADSLTLSVGEKRSPSLTLLPADAGDKRITLTSDAPSIVVVLGDSLKGLAPGIANITAASFDARISTIFRVKVAAVRVTEIKSDDLKLNVGDSLALVITVLPANATVKTFTLVSSDSLLAKVVDNSVVALKAGSLQIFLASTDGGDKDTLLIDIKQPVKGLAVQDYAKEVGDKFAPLIVWDPLNATDQAFTLTSKDSSIVKVVGDSLLAMAAGTDSIFVTSHEGNFKSGFKVTVAAKVFKVKSVKSTALRGIVGDTLSPSLDWDPIFATEQGYALKSLDTSIVKVSGKKLIALANGNTKIALTTVDGALADTFAVAIENTNFTTDILPITSLKCAPCHVPPAVFNWKDSAQLIKKGTISIDRLTRPDSSIGKMPLAGAPNGNLSARELRLLLEWLSRVSVALKTVTLVDMTATLGDSVVPTLTWTPANASNLDYTLTTSDTILAPVVGARIVPQNIGTFTVFVETDDGKRKLQAKLTVGPPVFSTNVLPITTIKCAPCHDPGQTYNFQDSALLILSGAKALDRLQRDPLAAGKMPLRGAPAGDLSPLQKIVLLAWLNAKVVPLQGITVPDDSLLIDESKTPQIIFTPSNANNKSYSIASTDTTMLGINGGEYFGRAVGTVPVEVRALDGNFLKLINVKVKPVPVSSVISYDTAGAIGDTLIPRVEYLPLNATDKAYTLSLVRASTIIGIVAGSKSVVCLSVGKDSVFVSTLDGLVKTKIEIAVGPVLPKSITVRDTNSVIGTKIKPVVVWNPINTTNRAYTLTIATGAAIASVVGVDSLVGNAVGQVDVTAKSTVDPSLTKVFKFTVGPVPVISFTMTATTQYATMTTPSTALNARAFISAWNPTNATDKRFTMVSSAPTKVQVVTDTTFYPLVTGITPITVSSLSDPTKQVTWNVTVIRPVFSGSIKTILLNKCGQCHGPLVWPARNWQDSTQVVAFKALISTRINAKDLTIMPPAGATNGILTATEITTLTAWLKVD